MRKNDETLYGYLKMRSEKNADEPALFDETQTLNYERTLMLTDGYARALFKSGVREGDFVALQSKRKIEAILIAYALHAIGAVVVYCHPHEKVKDYLSSVGSEIPFAAYISAENGKGFELIKANDAVVLSPDFTESRFEVCKDARKAALVLFTSGTTSKSKAVLLSQQTMILNGIKGKKAGWYDFPERGMIITPLYHLLGLMMVYSCIVAGYTLFVPAHSDPEYLFECIQKYKLTFIHGVPTTFITASSHDKRSEYDLSSLKMGMMAGGACGTAQAQRLEQQLGITIIQSYGLSEAVGITTMPRSASMELRTVGVGKVFPLTEACIKSNDGIVLKNGESGEVCARGDTVMIGYYNNDKANAEVFDKDGWFHTGDLGYFDDNGFLHLIGRKKDIIIRGGENISVAKIETAISSMPCVRMAVVVGIEDDVLGEISCAMVVAKNESVTEKFLLSELNKKLMRNELPDKIALVKALPLLGTGKPDKLAVKKFFVNGGGNGR